MNKMNKLIVALIVVIVVAGGAIIFSGNNSDSASDKKTNTNTPGDKNQGDAATITYDGTSFTMSRNSIKSGEKIKVVNNSQSELEFDSNPHPVHTDDPELNAGTINAGESKTFTLTAKGTWGFHNHLNASQNGEITVE